MPDADALKATSGPAPTGPPTAGAPLAGVPLAGVGCVVGIGASAGGLEACRNLLATIGAATGMAFILVQHLDPTHESMMAELLAGSTAMPVVQATDGLVVQADHLYLIPPGAYLAYRHGALHLSNPPERHGARLPFDFFLSSLAGAAGPRGIAIVLSGSGADGARGCQALAGAGGLVIAQDPREAAFDGMPRNAIASGAVDLVLPVGAIAAALVRHGRAGAGAPPVTGLARIIDMLRARTPHDFTLYKQGTLERRIARRMALAGIPVADVERYITLLDGSDEERQLLTEDLLINVTCFFRDPKIFDILESLMVPDLARAAADKPIRIWVAGCSTGEETYSLAMLFHERSGANDARIKLQIFASDVDPRAIAKARDGLYPFTIAEDVSPARLARFFVHEDHGYRINQDLRASVVFAVQDVLSDPPFSRLDLISCRNLLIYLRPEAQARIVSIFNFALRGSGFLWLGSAETAGTPDGNFELISKPARLYRKLAPIGTADVKAIGTADVAAIVGGLGPHRPPLRAGAPRPTARPADIAELCRRHLLESFAPAAVLINARLECLYSTGPTAAYMRVAPGYPSHKILDQMQPALRTRTKAAIAAALAAGVRTVMPGGRVVRDGVARIFEIDIQPVAIEGETLLLLCFADLVAAKPGAAPGPVQDGAQFAALERELEETRIELQGAFRSLELSGEEQNAINEEALSVNEEYQSTNEELLTSKEELQSLNEELTALNSQLQETLERSRMTSNDLQNILYSTDVATLFLDLNLKIRFFTPATTSLFTIIAADIGRPLADFRSLAADTALLGDTALVLQDHQPSECEIQTPAGIWFNRRILPYRTHERLVAGVVITFTDITERKQSASALLAAQAESERANLAKSRFLAAASHDLRQPLQALTLLSAMLAKAEATAPAAKLIARLDATTGAMATMLNTLLDINQIDSGIVKPNITSFRIDDLLQRLRTEFDYQAESRGLRLRVVPCRLMVVTDAALLEQMLRNLLANALKYTAHGRILLGCRRRGPVLSIKVGDTGIGIPGAELTAIFDEFHQVNNPSHVRTRGLGLGLSIVHRLGLLLGLQVQVRSILGRGSVFAIEVPWVPLTAFRTLAAPAPVVAAPAAPVPRANILVLEDDETVRDLLAQFLTDEGHVVLATGDGAAALQMVAAGAIDPDLLLSDLNLPGGLNGVQVAQKLRDMQHRTTPVIILSGDTSAAALREIATQRCTHLSKPMRFAELLSAIGDALATAPVRRPPAAAPSPAGPTIFIVDDDPLVRESLGDLLLAAGWQVERFASCEAFLALFDADTTGCLLVDSELPGMCGLDLLTQLAQGASNLPSIMITGKGDIRTAVAAMQAGASDFLEKPINAASLRRSVQRALHQGQDSARAAALKSEAAGRIQGLTARQLQIMDFVLAGHPNKNIAADLGISQRTVENHRASIMDKTGAKSLPALARLAMAADHFGKK
jgi:two-component system CheB/CheR fusion protein